MRAKLIPIIASFCLFGSAQASLDDFVELDEEQRAELNAELGWDVDVFFAHRDMWIEGKDAPVISLKFYTIEEDGVEQVGSYDVLTEALRGKSNTFKMLFVQMVSSVIDGPDILVSRLRDYDLFEDHSALMFVVDFADTDELIWQQFQIMQWSEDRSKKCTIASESSERIAAFYEDSVTDALIELMAYCAVILNEIDESNETS